MNELYAIMRELLEVEYNQKALLYMMEMLEKAYEREAGEEPVLAVSGARYYLTVLHRDLEVTIGRLDAYVARQAGDRKS